MKELRAYVVNVDVIENYAGFVTDDIFIELAEKQGSVYTLKGFEIAFNYQELNPSTDMVKFIEVEV